MSLLREIQNAAIDSNQDLAGLLRKCKVLAARLGSSEFKEWVERELSGYKSAEDLPDYRIFHVNSKGNFAGAFGSGMKNADIPMICIPEDFREVISTSYMAEPVASIEALVKNNDSGTVQEPWNPDFVVLVGRKICQHMNCMQAWKVIPINGLVATLDEIRNRILNFVIEIEAEDPAAGEAELNSKPVAPEKVQQIFNTYISGDVQNVATGSHSFEQHATKADPNAELFSQLLDALKDIKDKSLSDELTASIEEMRASQDTGSFKSHYQNFMSLLSNHITVLGPLVAPFLPALAAIVS